MAKLPERRNRTFGQILKRLRRAKGLNVAALVKRARIDERFIIAFEKDEVQPSRAACSKLGRALGFDESILSWFSVKLTKKALALKDPLFWKVERFMERQMERWIGAHKKRLSRAKRK
jgi:transcriptional regulator with XRE-family HTH domain